MTVTLDLPSDLETRIRDRAAVQGVDPAALVLRVLRESHEFRPNPPNVLPAREAELLGQLDLGFPAQFWDRYDYLAARLEADRMTADERDEFVAMSDRVEVANAGRIGAVVELARLRGTKVDALMDQLGIRPRGRRE